MPDLKVLSIVEGVPRKYADVHFTFNDNEEFANGPGIIGGGDRVVQDVVKGMLTEIGSNYLSPSYGTTIPDLVGSRSVKSMSEQLSNEIQTLMGYLGSFNIDEPISEQISEIVSLDVVELSGSIAISLSVKTLAGETQTVVV